MSKILVSFFSASGVTKGVAEKISNYLEADIFEIKPAILYTSEDLDWTDNKSRSSIEMADRSSRPKIVGKIDNIMEYDTILIGFPVWWDLAPTIINTFIEENDLDDKKIYIFVTSGSSSVTNSFNTLKSLYPQLNFINGIRLTSDVTKEDIKNFIV